MYDDDVTNWLHHQLTRRTATLNTNGWSILKDSNDFSPTENIYQSVSPSFTSTSHQLLSKMCGDSGCESDCSQPRRTSRVTTPLRLAPGMIQPSQDSRRGLFLPSSQPHPSAGSSAANPTGRKRGRSTSRSECETVIQPQWHRTKEEDFQPEEVIRSPIERIESCSHRIYVHRCYRRVKSKPSHSRDLRQDSDDENARIRKKSKKSEADPERKEEVYDAIEIYFEEPTPGSEDVTPDYVFIFS
ncbi:uncharacterized protein MELLADRAFT_93371 [Melampsora larici-populina 98AG31]|uniref:Uncharacterized protein n=1 Tax=Melampsora larici-populina (strain 98AG31 / pathotype 3-4-7) TaxID=747676 RepID=F4RA54_MELLP|nr:uncharacterized protein MELLADRAFT_93371 [Melampsora larici-populina 98AG31]EGG10421.1 hypothetical protein MELLADRAFT_93371 [Melampsora larici-populina 98AG31]